MGAQGRLRGFCPSLTSRPPAHPCRLTLCPGSPGAFSTSISLYLWFPFLSFSEQLSSEGTEISCHLPPVRLFPQLLSRAEPPSPGQGKIQMRPHKTSPLKIVKNCPVPDPCLLTLASLYSAFFPPTESLLRLTRGMPSQA